MIEAVQKSNSSYFGTIHKKSMPDVVSQTSCYQQLLGYEYSGILLAMNNVSFKSTAQKQDKVMPKKFIYNIYENKNIKNPEIVVTINSDNNFRNKTGVRSIYLFALNDQIYNRKETDNIKIIDSNLDINNRSVKVSCASDDISKTLDMIFSNFIDANIDSKYINEAKKIAPVGLFLSRKTDDFRKEYSDIPKNLSEQEYEKLLTQITENDIKNLNNDIIKNSVINIKISLNEKDYAKHKDYIENLLAKRGYNEH